MLPVRLLFRQRAHVCGVSSLSPRWRALLYKYNLRVRGDDCNRTFNAARGHVVNVRAYYGAGAERHTEAETDTVHKIKVPRSSR